MNNRFGFVRILRRQIVLVHHDPHNKPLVVLELRNVDVSHKVRRIDFNKLNVARLINLLVGYVNGLQIA